MNYIGALYKVLKQIILTKYPEIEGIKIRQMGLGNYYRVTYEIKKGTISPNQAIEIMNETVNLYKIIGVEEPTDIIVDFETHY